LPAAAFEKIAKLIRRDGLRQAKVNALEIASVDKFVSDKRALALSSLLASPE
jgi:hypothetical protein